MSSTDQIVGMSAPPGGDTVQSIAGQHGTPPQSVPELHNTLQWVHQQNTEHLAALKAGQKKNVPSSSDPEKLLARLSQLQEELEEETMLLSLRELILHRLQLSHTLTRSLFPAPELASGDQASKDSQQRRGELAQLVERQTELVSTVLDTYKKTEALRPELEELEVKACELKQRKHELMANLDELQQSQESMYRQASDSQKVHRAQDSLDQLVAKVAMTRHIFQGLMLGSGVDWSLDPDLCDLYVGLGMPLESVI